MGISHERSSGRVTRPKTILGEGRERKGRTIEDNASSLIRSKSKEICVCLIEFTSN